MCSLHSELVCISYTSLFSGRLEQIRDQLDYTTERLHSVKPDVTKRSSKSTFVQQLCRKTRYVMFCFSIHFVHRNTFIASKGFFFLLNSVIKYSVQSGDSQHWSSEPSREETTFNNTWSEVLSIERSLQQVLRRVSMLASYHQLTTINWSCTCWPVHVVVRLQTATNWTPVHHDLCGLSVLG